MRRRSRAIRRVGLGRALRLYGRAALIVGHVVLLLALAPRLGDVCERAGLFGDCVYRPGAETGTR